MNSCLKTQHAALIAIARGSSWFMAALSAGRSLQLGSWCIGAGAVRNLVWDHLHGYTTPSALSDIDFAYFDATDLSEETDHRLQRVLEERCPSLPWEVTNQAGVHLWFERYFGHPVLPLESLQAAVATWPEYATSVALTLNDQDEIEVIAPLGLDDLFEIRVRRNPARVSLETYRQRTKTKTYLARWPRVMVIEE